MGGTGRIRSGLAALAVALLIGAPATASTTEEPPLLEQGDHRGTVTVDEPTTLAVDLAGDQARAQVRFEVPATARSLTATIWWSVATDPSLRCSQNDSVLDGSLEDRPVLDSRRTDAPDPEDPCTQPGRHLLNVLVADPADELEEGATVPYVLVLSTFGTSPDPATATPELTPIESVPFATSTPAEVATEPAAAPTEGRPLGQAVALTLGAVLAVAGTTAVLRQRGVDTVESDEGLDDPDEDDQEPPAQVLEFPRRDG